ncbi:MAG: alanine racemase, partial [Bacilli bacterium]|nr:alanine racemase [Bacilli bacterium]
MNFNAEIEIDLEKLKYNASTLKNTYSDYPYVFANVKNNAFGMGYGIINTLMQCGINYLYVSTLQEALDIRNRNQDIAILVNYEVPKEYIYDAIMNNITLTISSLEHLRAINE